VAEAEIYKKPTIYRGREHSEVAIPLAAMLKNGRLDLFEEVKGKSYFQVYSRGGDLVFQCGGFVGLIPLNEDVAIEVAPRVKISNLDRILQQAGAAHTIFTLISRGYAASQEASYLIDLLADALVGGVEEIVEWGKHKEYGRRTYFGHPRSGRILVKETIRLRAKNPGTVSASTSRFERDSNNVYNVCIRSALEHLIRTLSSSGESRHSARLSRLNVAWQSFPELEAKYSALAVVQEVERRMSYERLSTPYAKTLPLANAVLRSYGPSQRNLPPSFSLGSLIFDVASAFECYIRYCLSEHCDAVIVDGNLGAPKGGRQPLFPGSVNPLTRGVNTTPDVLIKNSQNASLCVLDVKYKPYSGMPDRNDINQALSYALAYGTPVCGLVYPSSTQTGRIDDFGKVGGVAFFGFAIALNAPDLVVEERRFATDVCAVLGVPLR
jgi:5-methylcytosine-specific restriction enzyme subunit McrC